MWQTTIKAGLEPFFGPRIFGYARWRNDGAKVSSEFAQDRRASVYVSIMHLSELWSAQLGLPTQAVHGECRHMHKYR